MDADEQRAFGKLKIAILTIDREISDIESRAKHAIIQADKKAANANDDQDKKIYVVLSNRIKTAKKAAKKARIAVTKILALEKIEETKVVSPNYIPDKLEKYALDVERSHDTCVHVNEFVKAKGSGFLPLGDMEVALLKVWVDHSKMVSVHHKKYDSKMKKLQALRTR